VRELRTAAEPVRLICHVAPADENFSVPAAPASAMFALALRRASTLARRSIGIVIHGDASRFGFQAFGFLPNAYS